MDVGADDGESSVFLPFASHFGGGAIVTDGIETFDGAIGSERDREFFRVGLHAGEHGQVGFE